MADQTKAELEAELKETRSKLEAAEKKNGELAGTITDFESAGIHDLSWYQKEIDRLTKALEVTEANLKGLKEKKHREEIDGKVIKEDQKKEKERELVQYNQSEHTRFRLRERPSKLNIFGNPDGPVFDLGVDLSYFNGPVQIPADVIIEMGQSIGMLTVEEAEKAKADLEASETKNKKAARLASELTDGISVLTDKFYADLDSVVYDDDSDDSIEPKESETHFGNANDTHTNPDEIDRQANGDHSVEGTSGVSVDSDYADALILNGNDDELDKLLGD